MLEEAAAAKTFDEPSFAAGYALAAIPARWALERRDWKAAAELEPPRGRTAVGAFPYAPAITYFARALGAARTGQLDARARRAREARGDPRRPREVARPRALRLGEPGRVDASGGGGLARATPRGRKDEASRWRASAAELEEKTGKHPVTPGAILPARELLGDMLLEIGPPGGGAGRVRGRRSRRRRAASTASTARRARPSWRRSPIARASSTGTLRPVRRGLAAARARASPAVPVEGGQSRLKLALDPGGTSDAAGESARRAAAKRRWSGSAGSRSARIDSSACRDKTSPDTALRRASRWGGGARSKRVRRAGGKARRNPEPAPLRSVSGGRRRAPCRRGSSRGGEAGLPPRASERAEYPGTASGCEKSRTRAGLDGLELIVLHVPQDRGPELDTIPDGQGVGVRRRLFRTGEHV